MPKYVKKRHKLPNLSSIIRNMVVFFCKTILWSFFLQNDIMVVFFWKTILWPVFYENYIMAGFFIMKNYIMAGFFVTNFIMAGFLGKRYFQSGNIFAVFFDHFFSETKRKKYSLLRDFDRHLKKHIIPGKLLRYFAIF